MPVCMRVCVVVKNTDSVVRSSSVCMYVCVCVCVSVSVCVSVCRGSVYQSVYVCLPSIHIIL